MFAILLASVGGSARAAEPLPDPLPRDVFVARVLERYPTVASAEAAVRMAAAARAGAGAPSDPHLFWSASPFTANTDRFGQTLELTQLVGLSGRRGAEKSVADADLAMAEQDRARVRNDLALEAGLAWERWWSVDARLGLARRHEALANQLGSVAQERAAHGLSPRVDVLAAQSELALIEVDLAELAAERETVRIQLDQLLQEPLDSPVPPAADPVDPLPPDPNPSRPELAAAEARVDGATHAVSVARDATAPELELMASESTMWPTIREGWMLGIGSDVPLWWRARRASVDQARARVDQATAERQLAASQVDRDIAEAVAEVGRAEAVARLRRERLVPLALERLDTARIELSSGETGFDDVLRAERDLLDAEEDRVDAESAHRAALLSWRHAVGAPLPETTP